MNNQYLQHGTLATQRFRGSRKYSLSFDLFSTVTASRKSYGLKQWDPARRDMQRRAMVATNAQDFLSLVQHLRDNELNSKLNLRTRWGVRGHYV